MTMHSRGRGAGDLARAKRRFDQWRRSGRRGRLPSELWTLAADTASKHGADTTEPVDFRKGIDGLAAI